MLFTILEDLKTLIANPHPARFQIRSIICEIDFSFTDLRYLTEDEMAQPEDQLNKPVDFALGFHAPVVLQKLSISTAAISLRRP